MQRIVLASGRTRVVVLPEAGGRVAQFSLWYAGRWLPLLLEPRDPAAHLVEPVRWGSFVMAPWPNRIDGGRFTWRGRLRAVPANDGPHALHGRAHLSPWRVDAAREDACTLSVELDGGWPFGGRVVQTLRVTERALEQRVEVRSTGAAFPCGVGWHPWFRRAVPGFGAVAAEVPADVAYELDEQVPTGWTKRPSAERDLRRMTVLGRRRLDDGYGGVRGPMRIAWGALRLTMTSSENVRHAVVHTTARGVCIEPQTCAIDGFNLEAAALRDAGVAVVAAGRPLVAETIWRWDIHPGRGDRFPVRGR